MKVIRPYVRIHVVSAVFPVISYVLEGMEPAVVCPQWEEELEELGRTNKEVHCDFDTAGTGSLGGVCQDVSLATFRPLALLDGVGVHGVVSIWH